MSHILKISDEELLFITGIEDEKEALTSLFTGAVRHILYTKGAAGSMWISQEDTLAVPSLRVDAIDTTGAGDAFIGSVLYQIQSRGLALEDWSRQTAAELLSFANAAAGITTTRKGAIASFPGLAEIYQNGGSAHDHT